MVSSGIRILRKLGDRLRPAICCAQFLDRRRCRTNTNLVSEAIMKRSFSTLSPANGQIYVQRNWADEAEIDQALARAVVAQQQARAMPLSERMAMCTAFVDAMLRDRDVMAEELTWQMGRPISQAPGELRGFEERARRMIELAPSALDVHRPPERAGFSRFVRRVPLGVVLVLSPWNYPYLTSVNAVIPALLAGNAVILKHSEQTPLCAERYGAAAAAAGLPSGLFQYLHLTHDDVAQVVADPRVDYVAFTGSVAGGRAVTKAASSRFIGLGLELGGKDPAYVCADANVPYAVEQLVDGSFFNSGQSCCGIERIYVHATRYEEFVTSFAELTTRYVLGDPLQQATTLGPLVKNSAADFVRAQIAQALAAGARALIDERAFPASQPGTAYLAPQVLVDVDHTMAVMQEESFGPVVGIMAVADDEQALQKMNDSRYGLTASLWTADLQRAAHLGERIAAGTVFANRCDYLDPDLAWTGVKDSGRGCTLSVMGFEHLTRPQSFHLKDQPRS